MQDKISLEDHLFPVQAFFNAMPEASFLDSLRWFAQGTSVDFNGAGCEFPEELEPGDEAFSGVRFYILDEEAVLDAERFMFYLRGAAASYLERHASDALVVEALLEDISRLRLHGAKARG